MARVTETLTDLGYRPGKQSSAQEISSRQEAAWEKLRGRKPLTASERGRPGKYAVEVKHSFSRFPQLCHKVSTEGCPHCDWRLKRMNLIHDLTKHERLNTLEAERFVKFYPGTHGLTVDTDSGIIMNVQLDSQAAAKGIQDGFRITKVNGMDYFETLLDSAAQGSTEYYLSIAVEANKVVVFQPTGKKLGMKLEGNNIKKVSEKSQAHHEDVKEGWRIIAVGDVRCVDEKLKVGGLLQEAEKEAQKTAAPFKVTFDMEMELFAFHDGDSDGLTVVYDQAPVTDMLKVRGLFNLLPGPPRRERRHKDKSVAALAGIQAPMDMHRFICEKSHLLSEYQVNHLSDILAHVGAKGGDGKVSSSTCTKRDFENAVARAGLQHRLSHRKVGLAFLRLVELDRQVQERRKAQSTENPQIQRSLSTASMGFMPGGSSSLGTGTASLQSRAKEKHLELHGKLTPHERRKKVTTDWHDEADFEDEIDEDDPNFQQCFHIISWWRACEHCAVQLDCRIEVNEDVEWTFAIYDMLDMKWPWKPLVGPDDEECVEDERGKHFRGLLLGITGPPFTASPKVQNSTLTGCRARDGHVLHKGCELTLERCGSQKYFPITKPANGPAIVTLRLDRRRLKHDRYNTKNFASRLWIQRVVGKDEKYEDREACILIDNVGIPPDVAVIPAIYANSPVNDVTHNVKLWHCRNTDSPGMRKADTTIGYHHSYRHDQVEITEDQLGRNFSFDRSPSRASLGETLDEESDNSPSRRSMSARSRPDSSRSN